MPLCLDINTKNFFFYLIFDKFAITINIAQMFQNQLKIKMDEKLVVASAPNCDEEDAPPTPTIHHILPSYEDSNAAYSGNCSLFSTLNNGSGSARLQKNYLSILN